MYKKKILTAVISLSLVAAMFLSGSLTSSAYYPTVKIVSSDWQINTSSVGSAVYPEHIDSNYVSDDVCYQYSDLNGQTYYGSRYWDDDYVCSENLSVVLSDPFGDLASSFLDELFQNTVHFLFLLDNYFVLMIVNVPKEDFVLSSTFVYDDSGNYLYTELKFLCYGDFEEDIYTVGLYRCGYPYDLDSWEERSIHSFSVNETTTRNWFKGYSSAELLCSNLEDQCYYIDSSDSNKGIGHYVPFYSNSHDFFTKTWEVSIAHELEVLTGMVSYELSATELKFLNMGAACCRISGLGFIIGTQSHFWYLNYRMAIYDSDGNFQVDLNFCTEQDYLHPDVFEVGYSYFTDYAVFADFELGDNDYSEYTVEMEFIFVSDGYNLFFPGTFEIIEFESYEDDVEHDEVLGAIEEAASVVSGEIASASSELSSEIAEAATDITSSVNSASAEIVTAVGSAAESISGSVDNAATAITEEVSQASKNITEKIEAAKNSLLEGIKNFFIPSDEVIEELNDEWAEMLKDRFGALYEVTDIISDFVGSLKYAGEKNTIEFPEVTVHLVDTDFTFGGYEVQVIPDNISALVTALKTIISISCTLLFVNALKYRYDKLIGGNSV